jgi:hypothetical protein
MSRAAVSYKSKRELDAMSASGLNDYIILLKVKASTLGTSPRKELDKKIAVAEKIYEKYFSPESEYV